MNRQNPGNVTIENTRVKLTMIGEKSRFTCNQTTLHAVQTTLLTVQSTLLTLQRTWCTAPSPVAIFRITPVSSLSNSELDEFWGDFAVVDG